MTLPMARDLGVFGIRVLTVCPGIFDTPLMAAASDPVKQGLAVSVVAPKRLGRPQEFGLLVSQLIENSYMNGEVIRLDGGIRVGSRGIRSSARVGTNHCLLLYRWATPARSKRSSEHFTTFIYTCKNRSFLITVLSSVNLRACQSVSLHHSRQ